MRIVAIIAAYNEERLIENCLRHYQSQGVEVYLLDNDSTDRTVELAKPFLEGGSVLKIDSLPRNGCYSQRAQLAKKSDVIRSLDADWVIHADVDEIRLPPRPGETLNQAFARASHQGYNAVNFLEFSFVPTLESPTHTSESFQRTMTRYYHMAPQHPWHVKAWVPSALPEFDLIASGGHWVESDNRNIFPEDFKFRHYLFLDLDHAKEKYLDRQFDQEETAMGWHAPRHRLKELGIQLPRNSDLLEYLGDEVLDASAPLKRHLVFGDEDNGHFKASWPEPSPNDTGEGGLVAPDLRHEHRTESRDEG